jgi:hypothetical protein
MRHTKNYFYFSGNTFLATTFLLISPLTHLSNVNNHDQKITLYLCICAQDSDPDSTISIQSPVSVQKEQLYTLAPTESLHVKGQIDAEKNYRKRSGQIGE